MKEYDPADYWASRYEHFNITSSGHVDLPMQYNAWLYKMKKKKIRKVVLGKFRDFSELKVLELGCGTGVYVEMWKRLGVHSLTGLDIAPNAVEQLKQQYPEFSFHCEDMSDESLTPRYGTKHFDIVTVIGVLVHIVNDELFIKAVKNISRLVKEEGLVLISDYVVRGEPGIKRTHMKLRSHDWFHKALTGAGLELEWQVPLYCFMIYPFDTPSLLGKIFLPRIHWLSTKMIRRFPRFTGSLLYFVDSLITPFLRQGPSEKLFVYRKTGV